MDAELRQKKLASGKEKLAAFRNKKAKAPKKSNARNDTNNEDHRHQDAALRDFSSSTKSSEETSPSEALSLSDSELCSLPSDDEHSDEEGKPHIPFTVTELENAMDGQHLISEMIQFSDSSQWTDLSHVESALSQRDELLSQLASSLKLIQELPTQTDDFTTQLYALAQHICLLKTKLNQANQDLQEQLLLHESSMISLQAAKAQILQLQMIIIKKDEQISSMSQAVQLNSDSSIETLRLKDEAIALCQSMLQAQSEQLEIFKSELEVKVVECQRWAAAHEEWTSKEQNLMVSISSKSEECTELQKSFHMLKLEEADLLQKCALLQATLVEKDADDRLQKLEQELVQLRSIHKSDTQEISRLQKRNNELESVVDYHSKRLSYYQCLQQDYEHIMNQHSGCLSQLESLQQRINVLGQADHDLQVLKQQFENLVFNYQSEVHKRSELEMQLSSVTNSSETRTLMSASHSGPSVLSSYFSDFSTNNSSNYSKQELNLATVPIPHIHHNVLSGSSDEQLSATEKNTNGNVCNTQPDSDGLHLVAMIDDLKLKLKASETDCQGLAEKLKLFENENTSAHTAHDVEEKHFNSKEVELLQAEINTLKLQVQTQEAKLTLTTSELAATQGSLHSVQLELAQVRQEESTEDRGPEHPILAADDTYYLQLVQQQLSEKETAQEELQSQLESTITQWQKLQLIVQEKEIDIQNLQENLDEQKRICSNMSTSHQEYIEVLLSESDSLKLRLEEYQEKFFNMENEILHLITERNSHQQELAIVTTDSQKESSKIDSQTRFNNHDVHHTVVVDAYIQTDCVGTEIQVDSMTYNFYQQTEGVDINIDCCTENNLQKSPDHQIQHVKIEEKKELIVENDSVINSLLAAMSEKELQIQELEAKVLNIEDELLNAKVSHEDMGKKSIQLSEEKLAQKDAHNVSTSKKATAQQLKLKASKKQVAQKEEIITDLNKKLAESHEQISDLSRQKEDIIADLNIKLKESQEYISELSRQKEEITDLNKKLSDSQQHISDLNQQKEEILKDLNKKLADSQEQISDLSRQKEEIITDLNKKLADSQEQISDLSRQLAERNFELSELNCKGSHSGEPQTEVGVENQGTLELLHDSIRLRDDQISSLTEQLLVKNSEIASFHATLNEKEEYVTSLKMLQLEKEEICYAQGDQLTAIRKELLEKEAEIILLNTKVVEKTEATIILNNALSDNEGQISALKNCLHEKESDIATMQGKVCEDEELIKSLQEQLAVRVEKIEKLERLISDMEKDITDLNRKLSEKESQILELQNVVSEEMSCFQKTITERDEQLSLCNLKLQESSEEIIQLKGIISEKDQENTQMLQQLQAGQSGIVNLNEQLKEKETEILNAAKWLIEKEEEMCNLQTELSGKTSELVEIRLNLSKQNEEMTILLAAVNQRDEQLGTLQRTLIEKSDYVSVLSTKGSETDESILALKADLIEKEKENASLLEQIAEKEEALAKLFLIASERTDEIKELSDHLSKQYNSSQKKAGEVNSLNGQLLEKDEALGNLLITLSVKDDLIVDLNRKLSHLTEDLVGLHSLASEKDSCIATLTYSLSMKDDEFTVLEDKAEQLSEIKDKLFETEVKLTQCEAEKKDLAAILIQKGEEIAELYKNISEKDRQLLESSIILEQKAETDKQASEKDVEMTSLHKHLMEKDEEISHLHEMLVEKNNQIKSSANALSIKESDILRLQSELTGQWSDYNRKLFDKDEEIGNLLITLSGKDEISFILSSKVESYREKDKEISSLQSTMSEKENQILDLHAKVSDLENSKLILQKELENIMVEVSQTQKDFSDEVVLLKNLTSEKDDQMLNLQRSLDERENEIIQLTMTMADKNKEVASFSETISELNNALLKLQKLVEEKDALIMQIQNAVIDQTGERDSFQKCINNKNDEINKLQMTIESNKEENLGLQMTLNEKIVTFAALQTQLKMEATSETELSFKAKDDEISKQAAQISEFQEHISNMKKQLEDESFTSSEKDGQINVMGQKLLEKDELISSKEKEIADLFETINNIEKELFQANQGLTVKDDQIVKMAGVVQEHTEICYLKVTSLQQQLVDSESTIDSLKLKLFEGEILLKDTTEKLMLRDAEKESLKTELHFKETDYEALHLKLEELTDSNNELNDNIASLKQELSDCKTKMNDKDTLFIEALNTLSVRDSEIESLKKEIHSKETDYETLHLKLEELTDSNNELNDNIALLKQELSDCKDMVNDKDTKLIEALNTLVEQEKLILQLEPEKSHLNEQLVQHDILTSELQDKILMLESELNQQKTHHHEVVESLNAQHSVLSVELEILKITHEKKGIEYSLVEQERQESHSKITKLEAELSKLLKDLEESNHEKQSLREGNEQLLSVKEKLLQNLDDLKQNIEQKDLEIVEILSRIANEQKSCKHLMKCNKDLEKSYCLLQSSFSNLLEKSEENQSLFIQQEIKLQEQESTIKSLLCKRIDQETNPDSSKGMKPASDVDELDSQRDILMDSPGSKGNLKLSYQRLMNQFLVLSDDSQQKEDLLIGQKLELERNSSELKELFVKLEDTNTALSESLHCTASLRTEVDALKVQCHTMIDNEHTMKQKISTLEAQVESQEIISSHHVTECNRLAEQVAQLSQDLEIKEKLFDESKQESGSYLKELNDLKAELEIKSITESSLKEMVDSLTSSLNKSQEERELLKANFDSCMEDMQQKLTQQELETQRLRSKLAEQTKTVFQGQDQLKDIFEVQICQLEEKLLQSEKQSEQLAKDLADSKTKYTTCKDLYEGQLSDLEISLQSANSEVAKLRDQLSKIMNNHECAVAGLKRLHEIQTNELEDSCLALERNVSELRRQINEQTSKFNKERNNLEQSIEFQLSDNEEKRRVYEAEISRLRRHLEEMKQDHEMEMRNLEKSCEGRMYELEDKCCIATNELERLRKSFSTDGDYSEERHRLDLRIDELETKRRDLEIHNRDLEEDIHHVREQLLMREDELKSLLHSLAEKVEEKGTETAEEIVSLRHQLTEMSHEKKQALDSFQSRKTDLEKALARNEDLQLKITELEQLVEQLVRVRKDEDGKEKSGVENLQSQINSLSEENNSLKRQLSLKAVSRQSISLKPGVEAICPPYSHVSTHYSSSTTDECFSPVVEPEVLEGFVAENNSNQAKRDSRSNINNNSVINQEPDFVEEKNDRFQPEMEQEREMDSTNQLNMHPIWENEIHEGFEPETSDLFLIEPAEEPSQRIVWPRELSVGMSPSHHKPPELQFDFNLGGELVPHAHRAEDGASGINKTDAVNDMACSNDTTPSNDNKDTKISNDTLLSTGTELEEKVSEKQMNELREHLEEQYVLKMRTQEATLMCQYEAQVEKYKKEMEQHFAQKVQAVRYEWERKFTKALRQLKRDMERKTKDQELKGSASYRTASSPSSRLNDRPDIAERNMELGEQVEKLHKENQELAEVRDDLLRQIEISRARGLHDRVQHELQTMLTTRDMHPSSPMSLTPTPMSPTGDNEEKPTLVDQSVEEEADGSRSEVSESSSIRECFLEELEEISHQSGHDLPLEWELTSTETGVFEQEPASIWEVFDGRCARQDCQEVDSLRVQYGHQVASLQRQLEEERRCSEEQLSKRQDEYDQAVSQLRAKLDIELQDSLDQIMEELSQIHSQEVKHLLSTYQDELALELTALKISMEQIYTTKAQLETSQQQEVFQQKLNSMERRHKEEISRAKNTLGVSDTLEHLSETLTDDYNKLIQRISHELETKFASESGDSGFSSHTSQELCSLLLSQQEEITVLRSKLLTEYSSLLHSRVETMTEQAEEVNKLEDQMKDIKKQCDRQMVHLQESIKSQQEYESKETEDEDKKLKENIDQLKERYEIVIEKMESEFNAKIRALQDKYEEQLSNLIPFSTGPHTVLDSQAVSRHPINSRDNSVESGSFSESVEKDMSDQLKKLEAELSEREAAQQRLKNDLVNEQLRCKTMEEEVSHLKEALNSLKAEHETTTYRCSHLESLVKEREERIVHLEKEKVESEKLYRDLLEKESSSKETKDIAGISLHPHDDLPNVLDRRDGNHNPSPPGEVDIVESLEKHLEELEQELVVAKGREQELQEQMEEKEHAYKEMLESLKLELEHEKQIEIETLQSEFKVQLGVELKHQAAEMASKWSEVDQQRVVRASSESEQNPDEDEIINVLDENKRKEISELEEELRTLKQQLRESEDRYDSLMQGIQSGEHAEFDQLFQDKYDKQLELVKSYMQKDFDELLQQEKKSVVEKHRKLMIEMMGDRSEEETALQEKHKAELDGLRQELSAQFQEEREKYNQEISKLNHDLEELNASHSSKSDQVDSKHLTLPEINEIILDFQEVRDGTSEGSTGGNSAPAVLNDSNDSLAAMQMTEESPLHQAELSFDGDIAVRTFAEVLKSPPSLSTSERQEMTNKIQQLTIQVKRLTLQVEELQRPTPVSENSLLCTTDTLQGEDSALIAMLKSDLDRISIERESVQRTNDRLLSLLSDSVKTYIGVEDTISRRLSQNSMFNSLSTVAEGAAATASLSPRPGMFGVSQSRESSPDTCRVEKRGDADTSQDSHSVENTSFQSNGIDEGLEISQRLAECIFVGPDLDAEGEEILSDARGRLQNSISQLLELMERSCVQLQEAKSTQQDLLEALALRSREVESLNTKCHELNSQISAEIEAKEYLGLELHKAEGLIAGYISEHDSLESQIQSLEQQRESMILELDTTRSRLEQFEQSRSELDSFRDELHHQRQVLEDNAGQEIQVDESISIQAAGEGNPALLGEITSLNKDKRELANQLQQQLDLTRKRLMELETQMEESDRLHDAVLQEKLREIEDLNLQLENVERQLKASKSFVDEQMSEREQEREEHQREIEKLQEMLEAKERQFNSQQRLQIEIADLTEQLQSRMTSQSGMHQNIMDLQKALQDKELSAHDLKIWVAQLEKELDQRGDIEEQLKLRISRLEQQLSFKKDDSILDSAESSLRDTEKEKSPPLILSPVQTQRLTSVSLEEELRRCQEYEQELVHENKALKEQVQVQLLQISGLRNQLDELRQYSGMDADSDSSHLRVKLQASRDTVEKLEEKLSEYQNKIESLDTMLRVKAEETDQIKVKVSRILDMGDAAEENEHLKSQLEDLQNQISHLSSISSLSSLPPELLEEKNNEIQELREKLARLEKELLESQEENSLTKEKICEFQARLKEKDEEINDLQDNIVSLRRGEPFLDMSIPMNEEANNLLNISMTGRTSMHQEFEETILNKEAELNALHEKVLHMSKETEKKNEELESLRKTVSELQAEKDQLASLEETIEKKDSEIYSLTLNAEEMKQQNTEHTETIEILEQEIQKWEKQLSDVVEERDRYHSEVTEKDFKMDQMQIQIDNFQQEMSSLTNFQQELQKDFDTLHSMLDVKEKEIEALSQELTDNKSQAETLEAMIEKRNDEVSSLKQQLTEFEEQLRLRQTAVLDMQADKEILLGSVEDLKDLQNKLDERDATMEELESQLRFRQSRILDMEAEIERMAEEKEMLEANMMERLQEKDTEIDRLAKFNRSESVGNHGDLMQQTQVVSNQGKHSADNSDETLLNSKLTNETITLTLEEMGEKSSSVGFVEKDKEIDKLQAEIEALHQEAADSQQLEMQVKELQELLQEQEETAQTQITEYQAVIFKLQREVADLRAAVENRRQPETRVSRSANLSLTSSLDGDAAEGMTRWDSEPAGLAQSSMDSIHLRLNVSEAARMTRQQQRELHQKNYELENLRQNLERWLKMKDEGPMNELVKEKETLIISLRSEMETIREEVIERETVISSLRDELEAMKTAHIQELASKDHQLTQLQEEIYLIKSVRAHSNNNTGDQSLSPETKQSLSHLKLQLRKAHAALEEMQGVKVMTDSDSSSADGANDKVKLEVEELKEMLRAKEDELALYKTTSQIEQDEAIKKSLEELRESLEENHRQELQDLMSEYEDQMEVIREEKSDGKEDKEMVQKSTTASLSLDDTMPERLQLLLQQLNELGEHFLSVSDLQYLQQYLALHKQQSGIYDSVSKQDRQEFDDTIEAMKNLFNTVENLVSTQATEDSQDWRAEVLMALSHVYMKEKDLILAEINASSPELDLVAQLDSRLQHLAELQENNMEIMVQADRKSLVSELNSLKRELLDSKVRLQNVKDELSQQVSHLEENKSKLEWKLQRQVQMLECKLQQETVIQDDLKKTLKSERQRLSELTLQSTHDKAHLLELQSELSSTQIQLSKARDSLQREQQRFTSVTDALEEEKAKNIRLSELLEATKKSLESLREEVTESDLEQHRKSQSEENYIQKLQEELVKERQRCYQFSQAEDEAKRELTELANEKTLIQRKLSGLQKEFDAQAETLHREQEERETSVETVKSLKEILASERELHRTELENEKAKSAEIRNEIEIMKSRLKQVEAESDQTDGGSNQKHQHADRNVTTERKVHVHLKLVEEDREKLRVKVNDLEHELGRIQGKMEELETELEQARKTRESHNHFELHSVSQSDGGIYREIANDNLEQRLSDCCLKLQSVAHQLDKMTMTSHQTSGSFVKDQSTLVSVMSELKQLRGEIKDIGTTVPETASNAEQINRLLEHNKQLGDHIKQLKLEKKELISSLQDIKSKFQDTKRSHVQLPQYLSDSASEDGVYDRTVWASERLGLQMALDSAEHEIQRLRSEIQQFRAKIQSDVANTDGDKTSRLYGKYLRAESFRKALIYQKKYLLLLLGGYRDTEQETLAILASMGGFPHPYSSSYRKTRSKAFTKFRSAGRVIIAVSRMKYMVRKWKRATRVGSPVMSGQVSPHISYVPSSSSYPKHKRQLTHSDQHQPPHSEQPRSSRDLYTSEAYYRNTDDYLVANGGMTTSKTARSHTSITTPPTKDLTRMHRPSSKSSVDKIRRDIFAVENTSPQRHRTHNGNHTNQAASDGDDFLLYLQNIHKQLSEGEFGSGRELL